MHQSESEKLCSIVVTTTSRREAIQKLGWIVCAQSYEKLRIITRFLEIDTSHWRVWGNSAQKQPRKRPIEDYLNNKYPIASNSLKRRLIHEEIFEERCRDCGRTEWEGRAIPLELEHIDGNNKNNTLSNLKLLCPNCHALTPTYRGKNKKYKNKNRNVGCKCKKCGAPVGVRNKTGWCKNCIQKERPLCHRCGTRLKTLRSKTGLCSKCVETPPRQERPPYDELTKLIETHGWSAVGRMYKVSCNSIRKWVRKYEKLNDERHTP